MEGMASEPGADASELFSERTLESHARHQEMLSRMEQKWRARQIVVPTSDRLVMLRLRELGDPIVLFGEGPEDRRQRLRELLGRLGLEQGMPAAALQGQQGQQQQQQASQQQALAPGEAYATVGSEGLEGVRRWLLRQTLWRARARVAEQHRARDAESAAEATAEATAEAASEATAGGTARERRQRGARERWRAAGAWESETSQVGDERPLSGCALSPGGALVATASWSGLARLWDARTCSPVRTLAGHRDRVLGVAFHPRACVGQDAAAVNVATASADGDVMLWGLGGEGEGAGPLATLRGHAMRANRVAFHPCGRLLASTSADATWRLWDLDRGVCLLEQDGHAKAVYGAAFQRDGSLLATASADAYVRLWDLRTGACALVLEGHVRDVVAVDWAPDGCTLASAGDDHTARVWDVRRKRALAVIPAHSALISSVRLDRGAGDVLATAGFDKAVRLWALRGPRWKLLATIEGHEGMINGMDLSSDLSRIVTASYDRTWKLWTTKSAAAARAAAAESMAVDS
eukprot:m51a1_g5025 putative u4 u6 small nuclear ribonucleoprotein prp4 (522) ;mRNA; r:343115-345004